jgi:predicted small secreted protein
MRKTLIVILLGGALAVAACGPTENGGADVSPDLNVPSDPLLESPSDMLESPSAS